MMNTATATKHRFGTCNCGRALAKHNLGRCKKCEVARSLALTDAANKIVATGVCPDCHSKLRRNWALTGWYQCEQYGAVTHRARPNEPSCSFQTFTR